MSPPVAAAEPPAIHSSDLISSLPAPVLRLLVLFSRPISYLKVCIEVLSWKSGRRVESWCVVVVWWLVCLGSDHAFRWLLPALLFLPLAPLSKLRLGSHTAPPKPSAAHPATQDILLHTLSDLHAIHALVPPSPIPTVSSVFSRFSLLGPVRLTRGLLIIWATWIVLGRVVGFRSLLALMGSMILMYPSPALAHLYDTLSKSLVVRRSIALIFILVFGSPPDQKHTMSFSFSPAQWIKSKWAVSRRPSLALSFRPATSSTNNHANASESAIVDDDDSDELGPGSKVSEPIYFQFEVHENQRWWMGLDWTSALLPQERPSWCDSHLLPVLPPASYPLPPSATIILPHSTKSDPDGRVKRVANWRWLDDDWTIVRTGPNNPTSIPASTSSGFLANAASAASPSIPEDEGYSLARGVSASPATTHSAHMEESASTVGTRAQSIAEQAFAKGLERLKARTGTAVPATKAGSTGTAAAASPARNSGEFKRGRTGSQASEDAREIDGAGVPPAPATLSTAPMETIVERDEATDAEGWVYGDNKWDSVGPRGGLGKFTRRRRWHRRAILTETVYRIPSSPQEADATSANDDDKTPHPITPVKSVFANEKAGTLDSIDRDLDVNLPAKMEKRMSFNGQDSNRSTSRDGNARGSLDVSRGTAVGSIIPPASPTARDDVLRQRLKKAMGSAGG